MIPAQNQMASILGHGRGPRIQVIPQPSVQQPTTTQNGMKGKQDSLLFFPLPIYTHMMIHDVYVKLCEHVPNFTCNWCSLKIHQIQQHQADQNFYTVLSLRTCPQGRPLLPGACPLALNLGEAPWQSSRWFGDELWEAINLYNIHCIVCIWYVIMFNFHVHLSIHFSIFRWLLRLTGIYLTCRKALSQRLGPWWQTRTALNRGSMVCLTGFTRGCWDLPRS